MCHSGTLVTTDEGLWETSEMARRAQRRLMSAQAVVGAIVLIATACGGPAEPPEAASVDSSPPTTTHHPTSTVETAAAQSPATSTPVSETPTTATPTTEPLPREELGTCKVMGPSDGGWEVILQISAVLGGGTYLVEYALRDGHGTILERMESEIVLNDDDTVQYWDSPRTTAVGVSSCDVLRLSHGNDACTSPTDCVQSA